MNRRIALISEHASPAAAQGSVDCGGQNVYVAQVARQLARRGHEVDVFTRRDSPSLPDVLEWRDGVRVIHLKAGPARFVPKEELLPYMGEFLRGFLTFSAWRAHRYDIVHAHFWMSGLVAAEARRLLGLPFVVTFHALGKVRRAHQGDADRFADARFDIEERIVRECDRIIAECPQDRADLCALYAADAAKIATVPCGFDSAELKPLSKPLARAALNLDPATPLLLQLGRLVPRKGIDIVIRGFARLVHRHGISAKLLIVGGDEVTPDPLRTPEIARLQTVAREEGVDRLVTFAGRRDREVLRYYYSAADLFVTMPWYEPFGITPVEAMACGTPVIGARVGGIQWTVVDGETGFLVEPRDVDGLGARMAQALGNKGRLKEMGLKSIRRANAHFRWDAITEQIASAYEDALRARRPRPLPEVSPLGDLNSNYLAQEA
jgi:D-inositol-3-phosphate glycosyltransferase